MSYLAISKWTRYQHYKTRKPPWIKFYVELVDDVQNKLNDLPVPTRYLFDRLLLLAAKYDNAIPKNPELIANLVRMDTEDCREGLDQLLKGRWIKETQTKRRASNRASEMLAPENRVRDRKPQTPFSKARAFVVSVGWQYEDDALTEELRRLGVDDLEQRRLLALAADCRKESA